MNQSIELKPAAKRVQDAAAAAGLDIAIVTHPQSTRTAEEAAAACGCGVGQIVKSLVFQLKTSGTPILLLVSGSNRVNEKAVGLVVGEPLNRPDAAFVRDLTGYAIGGIPPLGHASPLRTFMDRDLLDFASVWAAAGTPECVFAIAPEQLKAATGATVLDVG